jgi:hypothetical protein
VFSSIGQALGLELAPQQNKLRHQQNTKNITQAQTGQQGHGAQQNDYA